MSGGAVVASCFPCAGRQQMAQTEAESRDEVLEWRRQLQAQGLGPVLSPGLGHGHRHPHGEHSVHASALCAPLAASHMSCADSAPTTEDRWGSPFPLSKDHRRPLGRHRPHPSVSQQVRWPRPPCCRSTVTTRAVACTSASFPLLFCRLPQLAPPPLIARCSSQSVLG